MSSTPLCSRASISLCSTRSRERTSVSTPTAQMLPNLTWTNTSIWSKSALIHILSRHSSHPPPQRKFQVASPTSHLLVLPTLPLDVSEDPGVIIEFRPPDLHLPSHTAFTPAKWNEPPGRPVFLLLPSLSPLLSCLFQPFCRYIIYPHLCSRFLCYLICSHLGFFHALCVLSGFVVKRSHSILTCSALVITIRILHTLNVSHHSASVISQ